MKTKNSETLVVHGETSRLGAVQVIVRKTALIFTKDTWRKRPLVHSDSFNRWETSTGLGLPPLRHLWTWLDNLLFTSALSSHPSYISHSCPTYDHHYPEDGSSKFFRNIGKQVQKTMIPSKFVDYSEIRCLNTK
jgi:hypothetical protein